MVSSRLLGVALTVVASVKSEGADHDRLLFGYREALGVALGVDIHPYILLLGQLGLCSLPKTGRGLDLLTTGTLQCLQTNLTATSTPIMKKTLSPSYGALG